MFAARPVIPDGLVPDHEARYSDAMFRIVGNILNLIQQVCAARYSAFCYVTLL